MDYKNKNANYEDRYYYLAFNHFQKIGPVNMKKLENFFPDMQRAYLANYEELKRAGLRESLINDFISWRNSPAAFIENMINKLEKEKISFISWRDSNYPALLKEIPDPPPLLYYKGQLNGEVKNRLAVVGSRHHSTYADKLIAELLPAIIKNEIEIVSGLALGVDALAHQAALDSKGITLAVLGSGLDSDNIYPRTNYRLAENIINNGGVIISEFPPGTPPYSYNFPQRNRIISGLAQATLVIEAKIKSGALITAAQALEQNREVLTVPGNIFSEFSSGPNELIKAGAKNVTTSEDILEIFKLGTNGKSRANSVTPNKRTIQKTFYQPKSANETAVYDLIKQAAERAEKITADEIIKITKLDTTTINSTLSILEIQGAIKNDDFGYEL